MWRIKDYKHLYSLQSNICKFKPEGDFVLHVLNVFNIYFTECSLNMKQSTETSSGFFKVREFKVDTLSLLSLQNKKNKKELHLDTVTKYFFIL